MTCSVDFIRVWYHFRYRSIAEHYRKKKDRLLTRGTTRLRRLSHFLLTIPTNTAWSCHREEKWEPRFAQGSLSFSLSSPFLLSLSFPLLPPSLYLSFSFPREKSVNVRNTFARIECTRQRTYTSSNRGREQRWWEDSRLPPSVDAFCPLFATIGLRPDELGVRGW